MLSLSSFLKKAATPSSLLLAIVLFSFLPLQQAHASYIDPNTGSYILQIGTAALFAALYTVKLFWKNMVASVRKLLTKNREK